MNQHETIVRTENGFLRKALNILVGISLSVLGLFLVRLWDSLEDVKREQSRRTVQLTAVEASGNETQRRLDRMETKLDNVLDYIYRGAGGRKE